MSGCDSKTLEIKAGATASFTMVYKDDDNEPIPLPGYTIFMDFREAKTGVLLASTSIGNGITIMEVAGDDTTTGTYQVNAGSTYGWQLGEMPVDIVYVYQYQAQPTEDFIIDIVTPRTDVQVAGLPPSSPTT